LQSLPGKNIISASRTSSSATVQMSGTSMATPLVAGAVALLQQRSPLATAAALGQVRRCRYCGDSC
jgi:subtilisin family serine protease